MVTPTLEDAPFIAAGLRECTQACTQEQLTLAARIQLGADMISRLYHLLLITEDAERAALNQWQPIDSAPADTEILVHWPVLFDRPTIARYDSGQRRWYTERCYWATAPINWQPLPEVPA